jgi:uncharacterized protein (TIGR03437 family)
VGGISAPLFYSSTGQVNAQIPFELAASTSQQLVLSASNTFAVPETITLDVARPGIFSANSSGAGQGAITNPQGAIVDSKAPAASGDVVIAYCSGLGATNPAVASNARPPSAEPLARVITPVTATVGGVSALVQFAGLSPGFVGLYQVNIQIPAGITSGPAVPVVIAQGGVNSNTVTIVVK